MRNAIEWNHLKHMLQYAKPRCTQQPKHHQAKLLHNSFHLNSHNLGLRPQTQNLEPPCKAKSKTEPQKYRCNFLINCF